ncbi:MAG: anthranilate synthase component I family protein [Deltaproteobacteria bacterium]|nr:anthranilate synthase component I family protein [Deltaproteobacteria bacterium]
MVSCDTTAPMSIYLRLRDVFPNTILLESTDFCGSQNRFSYICCDPIANFLVTGGNIVQSFPDKSRQVTAINSSANVLAQLDEFRRVFVETAPSKNCEFITNGLFGYIAYDAVRYFEDIELSPYSSLQDAIPDICFSVFQHVIVVDPSKNEMHIFNYTYRRDDERDAKAECLASERGQLLEHLVFHKEYANYSFKKSGGEQSNFTDEGFLQAIECGKGHNHRGDVFQLVLSRRFWQGFLGDEFNVYRALRSINPSPYLFYLDYGSFKIFGSSPESQIVKSGSQVSISPIAGTYRRMGTESIDSDLAEKLTLDPKENAEHVMLVDLARNDLSKHCENVFVEKYRDIQFYSHVIHLVSKVTGTIAGSEDNLAILGDTFPAGTLTGAPKYKAMELIDRYEGTPRGVYGGCLGYIGFNGDYIQAIIIRSFFSKNNVLYYQAGAGIVAESNAQSESNEVHNKLMALRQAMDDAEKF